MSHLLQMRGLKHTHEHKPQPIFVASFTDAWIETEFMKRFKEYSRVASFTDAWIETRVRFLAYHRIKPSHLLQMRGLKQS